MEFIKKIHDEQMILQELVVEFCDLEGLSDEEFDLFIEDFPSLTVESFLDSIEEEYGYHPCLVYEAQSVERRRELRQQDEKKKLLGRQFYAPKSASRDERLNAAANRAANFKWNKDLKRWEPRKKKLDANKIKASKIKKAHKFKAQGIADKASKRASSLRQTDTSKGIFNKLGKARKKAKKE